MRQLLLLSFCLFYLSFEGFSADSISEKTKNMKKYEGYFTFYWDEKDGKVWLEIDRFDTDFLYYNSLSAGAGSNDIGLDRGRLNRSQVMQFRRSGNKILFVEPNQDYRAITNNPDEQRAVRESFAEAVMFGFTIEAEEGGKVLVDATKFFMQDAVGVTKMVKRSKQGSFKLDDSRSAFYLPLTKNFPKNTEIEVSLTFTGDDAGSYLRSVSPNPEAFTVRQHHSFVELPDKGYEMRKFDPRSGYLSVQYMDYATEVDQPITQRFIRRHRLQKKDPGAAVSEAVEPIIYYLDPGAPEPIRSALMDGIRWWNQAFEASGYKDAFQVKLLPDDADPMDIRYNYVQWVHRSTRGWSYGSSVYDPRTGEIIKGKVTLGSLRVRQDFLIASGLVAAYEEGKPVSEEMMEMALQRIRQLGAHEVGHTLGLVHNYASTYEGRHSVMDYPHPLVKIKNKNELDLSEAYTNEIGAWDKVAIAYGYQDFPEGVDEEEALEEIIQQSLDEGLLFISDRDARASSGAHPYAHLWDNGTEANEELKRVMQVREIALNNLSEKKIPFGQPMATLEEVLVPMYMFHRYQAEATAKLIGGLYYTYALRGDGQTPLKVVEGDKQQAAIEAMLQTISPEALAIPEKLLELIPPYPLGYYENSKEVFKSRTGITFDPLGAAESAANFTLSLLLNHERITRMIDLSSRYEEVPGFHEMADQLVKNTIGARKKLGYHGELQRLVDRLVLDHMIKLAANPNASGQARAMASLKISDIKKIMLSNMVGEVNPGWKAHYIFGLSQIQRFEDKPEDVKVTDPLAAPDGSPIGQDELYLLGQKSDDWCGHIK